MGRSTQNKRSSGNAANKSSAAASGLDAGVVGTTGKRALRSAKSNGQLNGVASGTPGGLISVASNTTSSYPHANGRPETRNGAKGTKLEAPSVARRASLGTYDESSSSESYQASSAMAIPHDQSQIHRRIDVNSAKNPAVHRDTSSLSLLITVLRSCPLYDTIAILIVLLQIPPTFLTIIHLLFATLTFVPPSNGASSSFGFQDIFEGSIGTPSVATLVAVDVLVLSVWLFLWSPLQDIFLDLAQTVIALTLGGGTQGRDAGFNNLLVCLSIVGASHYAKGTVPKDVKPSKWLSFLNGGNTTEDSDMEAKKGGFLWVRTIVAVHILTQGIVRWIRDWYMRREGRALQNGAAFDSEAGSMALSADLPSTAVTTPDGDSFSLRKKKKVSSAVRQRQPLWSALASTKVVMAKEYEATRHATESAGTNATDINNLGNAPFNNASDNIWITKIGIDEVSFSTSSFSVPESTTSTPGADLSKPFYVRVNKTIWQPTRINPLESPSSSSSENIAEVRWSGEIFGLTPFSNYDMEFVSTLSSEILYQTSVRTLPAPIDISSLNSNTAPTLITTQLPRVASRPDSPTTTLRTSIQAAETKLGEEKARQKRERKELKSKLHTLRKEIERLSANAHTAGGNDDKLRMKVVQSQLHAKQAEESILGIDDEISALENIESDIEAEFRKNKAEMVGEKERHKLERQEYEAAKSAGEREVAGITNETQSLMQKRERYQSRIARLQGEYERLSDANKSGLDEVQRRDRERFAKETEREQRQRLYLERIEGLGPGIKEKQEQLQLIWASIQGLQQRELEQQVVSQQLAVQQQYAAQAAASAAAAAPQPSPTAFDGTYPWPGGFNTTYGSLYPTSTLPYGGGTDSYQTTTRRERGRSSSMLSGVSGFTLSDDEDAQRPKTANPSSTNQPHLSTSNGNSDGSASASASASGGSGNPSPHVQAGKTVGFKLKPPPGLGGVAVWRNPWDP